MIRRSNACAASPRPGSRPPPGSRRALHDLHHEAGWPSLRTLAGAAGCSRTTVSPVFSAPRLPTWGVVELLVEAMGGDPTYFHGLWLAAGTPEAPGFDPGIAGRKDELAVLRAHLESGSGLLLVTGEAGIGKTRLVATAQRCTPDVLVLQAGACHFPRRRLCCRSPTFSEQRGAVTVAPCSTAALTSLPAVRWTLAGAAAPRAGGGPSRRRVGPSAPVPGRERGAVGDGISATCLGRRGPALGGRRHARPHRAPRRLRFLRAAAGRHLRVEDPATPASVAEWRLRLQRRERDRAGPRSAEPGGDRATRSSCSPAPRRRQTLRTGSTTLARSSVFTEQLVSSEGATCLACSPTCSTRGSASWRGLNGPWPRRWRSSIAPSRRPRSGRWPTCRARSSWPACDSCAAGCWRMWPRWRGGTAPPLLGEAIRRRLTATETMARHRRPRRPCPSDVGIAAEIAEHWRRAGDLHQSWSGRRERPARRTTGSPRPSRRTCGSGCSPGPAEQEAVDVVGDPAVRRVEAYAGASGHSSTTRAPSAR